MNGHECGAKSKLLETEYEAQCDECNEWKTITESQHRSYSGTLIPFYCRDVGLTCQEAISKPKAKAKAKGKAKAAKAKCKAKAKRQAASKAKATAKAKGRTVTTVETTRRGLSGRVGRVKAKISQNMNELAGEDADLERQADVFDRRLESKSWARSLCQAHGIKRTITVNNGPARGWRVSGFLVDNNSGAGGSGAPKDESKVRNSAIRWRFESPGRSRVFKVWKSTKANGPSLADAVSEGAFEQLKRAIRPDVLRKLKVKRAAVAFRDSQTYKRQRSGPLNVPSHNDEVLTRGQSVMIIGLQNRQELNSCRGELLYPIVETGRWAVGLFDGKSEEDEFDKVVNVKPQNLVLSGGNIDDAKPIRDAAPNVQECGLQRSAVEAMKKPKGDGPVSLMEAISVPIPRQKPSNLEDTVLYPQICVEDATRHLRKMPYCNGQGPPVIHLQSKMIRVGRGVGNDVSLQSSKTPQMLSRNHAIIRKDTCGFFLVDQGSLNGVLLNGQRVYGEQLLKPGDVVTFGVLTPEPEFDYIFEAR